MAAYLSGKYGNNVRPFGKHACISSISSCFISPVTHKKALTANHQGFCHVITTMTDAYPVRCWQRRLIPKRYISLFEIFLLKGTCIWLFALVVVKVSWITPWVRNRLGPRSLYKLCPASSTFFHNSVVRIKSTNVRYCPRSDRVMENPTSQSRSHAGILFGTNVISTASKCTNPALSYIDLQWAALLIGKRPPHPLLPMIARRLPPHREGAGGN